MSALSLRTGQLPLELDPAPVRARRLHWKADAMQVYFGGCDRCGRQAGDDGRPLLVARQPRHRHRECFACFTARVTPRRRRRQPSASSRPQPSPRAHRNACSLRELLDEREGLAAA